MTIENGFAGQESDVNRACSAFGLDTVNYRAFPETGPVPVPPPLITSLLPSQAPPSQPQQPPPYMPQTASAPDAGSFSMAFPLLTQALPTAATNPNIPTAAFSRARTPLRSISSNQNELPQNQAINPAVFGAAFAAAFNAAFSTQPPATTPDLSSSFQHPQT